MAGRARLINLLELKRLVEVIEKRKPRIETEGDRYQAIKRHQARCLDLIEWLESFEHARFRAHGTETSLRLAGVSASCTMGPAGLLDNWLNAAKRRIADGEAMLQRGREAGH
ncbi:MAG: hypothetical protein VYD64_02385 [Pseudomonadota bacterium]|nr:hypothetical protein [Pseudomonadota bacterium]